jgi:hypothetical protein
MMDQKAKVKIRKGGEDIYSAYKEAESLLLRHKNNGGSLDYSETEYSYMSDALDEVAVGYFDNREVESDSDYAMELKRDGYKMNKVEAEESLRHRIKMILQECLIK